MTQLASPPLAEAVDGFVRAFEEARPGRPDLDWAGYAPPAADPLRPRVVRELVRIDLEFGWSEGRPRPLDEYCERFPDVFRERIAIAEIAFEDYRQRLEHGQAADPAEYARRYGIDTSGWSTPRGVSPPANGCVVAPGPDARNHLTRANGDSTCGADLRAYRQFLSTVACEVQALSPAAGCAGPAGDVWDFLREVHRSDPEAARRFAEGSAEIPAAGGAFLNFYLIEELGRGAFGRVFLAQQADLANRPVALKIAIDLDGETQTLAQLQHTNIVPIYSVHRHGGLQAICMPYFGATTLTDVIRKLHGVSSLPVSGRHLVSTLNDRKARTRSGHSSGGGPAAPGESALPTQGPGTGRAAIGALNRFEALSYVEAVVWLTARLAGGLAHAHERGIVHRDLKPANVLLTDEGEPMILDFNLSTDAKARSRPSAARIGGTLPYMSPEQLAAFDEKEAVIDARSDIFALGVIAFELLTGRLPYPHRGGSLRECVAAMRKDRAEPAPRLRGLNPAITPAIEAIVRRCLNPDPARRYRSADHLREDLERHLANQPLRHTGEPSVRERVRKWVRRHPRLTSSTSVGAVAAVVVLGLLIGAGFAWREHRANLEAAEQDQARFAAMDAWDRLRQARQVQQALANYPDRAAARQVIDVSRQALEPYRAVDDPDWETSPAAAHLPEPERARLREAVADILAGWSDAERELAETDPKAGSRREHLAVAWSLSERAEAILGAGHESRALLAQRARLAGMLGDRAAGELERLATATPPRTATDHFQLARELLRKHEVKKALPHLAEASRLDPRHFWVWHFLGNCRYELLQFDEAVACYSACIGLTPDPSVAYFPYYHRALVYAAQGRVDEAEADLDCAVTALVSLPEPLLRKERVKPFLEKARLSVRGKDYPAAEDILTTALEAEPADPRLLFERARVRGLRGDPDGARRDFEEGVRKRPADEVGWNDRGLARLTTDPRGALADFEEALKLNPTFYAALQNKAHVLSERLGQEREAMVTLDRIVELYPGYVRARIGRGVVLARQGKRAEAHADVRESLARDRSAATLYQAANVFALTSRQEPADADRVVPLLAAALWAGFGLDIVDRDSDMDPVRDHAAFKRVIQVVRELTSR
jgi:eukaryotic-like serine/threonine-protein kinase